MKKLSILLAVLGLSAPAVARTGSQAFVLEADHSYAYFKVLHMERGELTGVFKEVNGEIEIDGDEVRSVEVEIAVNSLDTFSAPRDAHLKSPDYFNARRFPKMKFVSRSIKAEAKGRYLIEGRLTIHGQTKNVKAIGTRGTTGKDPFGGYRTGGNVRFTINRRDFGITHMPSSLVGDEIAVDLYWEALEKSTIETYMANLAKAIGG